MTPKEVLELAHELHFIVDYDSEGQIILLTGVVDERKKDEVDEVAELINDPDYNDDDEDIFDPIEDPDWDPGDYE